MNDETNAGWTGVSSGTTDPKKYKDIQSSIELYLLNKIDIKIDPFIDIQNPSTWWSNSTKKFELQCQYHLFFIKVNAKFYLKIDFDIVTRLYQILQRCRVEKVTDLACRH